MRSVDTIVQLLHHHHQRATYGAVAGLAGKIPRSVMQGRKRCWRNSWVVNHDTGLPTEYPAPLIHPQLAERVAILLTASDLEAWLNDPS